jgi:pimeloyl-ACP methyl ester carboxylesterase
VAGLENGWHEGYAQLKGVRLHYVEAGQGPLVVLLHGFPEAWFSYRHQLGALAQAGFHAVAPDMRGHNLSSKPRGVRRYRLDLLARDVAERLRYCCAGRAVVVGHDWGALAAWHFAMRYPEMLDRLVILGVELAAPDLTWVPHARVKYLPDAGHWVQNDRPEQVNALLLDFLNSPLPRGSA